MRTVRLPLSGPAVFAGVAGPEVAAAELVDTACGAEAAGLPDGLGCDNALAF